MSLKPLSRSQCLSALRLGVRVVFWAVAFETVIHFFYASALLNDIDALTVMPLWAVAGVGYVHGQLFMVKYFVIFGGFCALARLDQLLTPGPPRCISYIYRYSQMWKYVAYGFFSFQFFLVSVIVILFLFSFADLRLLLSLITVCFWIFFMFYVTVLSFQFLISFPFKTFLFFLVYVLD